jgi:hypothetical protein
MQAVLNCSSRAHHVSHTSSARHPDLPTPVRRGTSTGSSIAPLFPAQEYPEFGTGFYAVTYCDTDHNVIELGYHPAALRKPTSSVRKRQKQASRDNHS